MFYLDPNSIVVNDASNRFSVELKKYIFNRIKNMKSKKNLNASVARSFIEKNISPIIDKIILGNPKELIQINDKITDLIKSKNHINGIRYVFNYKLFSVKSNKRYDAYNLAYDLRCTTCIYCNRNYTNTIINNKGKKISRPQFDHYFDKDRYPLLALSFYNLIPCCSSCNSVVKGTRQLNLNNHIHPYLDNELSNIKFSYKHSNKYSSQYEITIKSTNSIKAQNTIDFFELNEIYNSNISILEDLIKTKHIFNEKYLSILSKSVLKDVPVSKDELYRIAFGVEADEAKTLSRPFSKFKNDILKELNIID